MKTQERIDKALSEQNQIAHLKSENARLTSLCFVREREADEMRERVGTIARRERLEVAARIMAGMYACKCYDDAGTEDMADSAVLAADALIARIDASPADKEPRP